jgi:anti-anti-sigma factor
MTASSDSGDARLRVESINDEEAAWIIIHGEVDIANVEHLEAALASIQLDGAKSVHIDASNLDFVDVAALRQLADFAGQVKRTGRDISLERAQPLLHEVARALRFQDDLGLS